VYSCCGLEIDTDGEYAQVYPCGHDMHSKCLCKELALKKGQVTCCDRESGGCITEHKIIDGGLVNEDDTVTYPDVAQPTEEQMKMYRPYAYLRTQRDSELNNATEGRISVIYVATMIKSANGKVGVYYNSALISQIDGGSVSEEVVAEYVRSSHWLRLL